MGRGGGADRGSSQDDSQALTAIRVISTCVCIPCNETNPPIRTLSWFHMHLQFEDKS